MNSIRQLRLSDVPSIMRLSQAAGWNQLPEDWQRLIELEPEGCFGIESDGEIIATATAVCFSTRLAWIGMVLTDPAHRRRGHGRRLMEHALEFLDGRRVEWIKLDATEMGQPLYEQLGFEAEAPIQRWATLNTRVAAPEDVAPASVDDELDRAAFGADRSRVLSSLKGHEFGSIPEQGYAMGRAGAKACTFGPCVARSAEAARTLLQWFLSLHSGETVYWDLLPANRHAVRLASVFRFTLQRRLVRMVRQGVADAEPLTNDDSLVYATAGFEYG